MSYIYYAQNCVERRQFFWMSSNDVENPFLTTYFKLNSKWSKAYSGGARGSGGRKRLENGSRLIHDPGFD